LGVTDDLAELADLAESVAVEAAALLRDGLGRPRASVATKSTATDMVTEMDRAAEALVVERLRAARPDDGVLGEEGSTVDGTSGLRWVIDPLDGTTNYLYRLPVFAVSIAAERDGEVVAGAVVDVMAADVYRATAAGAATCNGEVLAVSEETDLARALVATGFGYDPGWRTGQAELLAEVIGQIRDIRRAGSAALDLCSVARGRVDASYEMRLAPWDFAAGALIARRAGAVVTDLYGNPPSSSFVVAAPPALIEGFRRVLIAGMATRAVSDRAP
jgi:myo-inositol-1(or 4)-monophosphatase